MPDSGSTYAHTQMATMAAVGVGALTFYAALFIDTANPGLSGTEYAMPGYARQSVTLTRTGTLLSNGADISWGDLGSSPWGGTALFDALTGGNLWYFQDYVPRLAVSSAVHARVLAAGLQLQLNP